MVRRRGQRHTRPVGTPIIAKLTRPSASGVHARPRLYTLLDRSRQQPIIWIAAPAGSGKTTLVAGYVQARRLPTLWYQIDAGDNDVASFFYYMGIAADKAAGRSVSLPFFTPEYKAGLPAFTVNFFRNLFGNLREPSAIVFDNYQEMAVNRETHQVLRQGLDQIPPGVNVIIISREAPSGTMARLRASNRMTMLGWEELKLTEQESNAITKSRRRKPLERAIARRLHEETQGWVAGLILLTEQVDHSAPDCTVPKGFANQSVFDYFASEIFHHSTPDVQTFLLRTAFLPKIQIPVANALLENVNGTSVLEHLTRRNLFTVKHLDGSYEYHPLFRAFLDSLVGATYTPDQIRVIKQRSAELLANHGDVEGAIALLQQTRDWPAMVQLVLQHAPALRRQGRIQTLEGWFDTIPETLRADSPWLLYWMGVCRLPFDPAAARAHFEHAFTLFEKGADASPLYLTWSRIIESYLAEMSDLTPMVTWLDRYHSLRGNRAAPSKAIEIASIFNYVSGICNACFDHPDLESYVQQAERLWEQETNDDRRFALAVPLILYYLWRGNITKMGNLLEQLPAVDHIADTPPLAKLNWYMVMSIHAGDIAAADDSLQAATDGLALADASGIHVLDLYLLNFGIWGQLSVGNVTEARALLQRMDPLKRQGRIKEAVSCHCESNVAIQEGNPARAVEECLRAIGISDTNGMYLGSIIFRVGLAYAYSELGDTEKALEALYEARPRIRAMRSKLFVSYSALCEANIHRQRGDRTLTLSKLREALMLAQEGGFVTPAYCPRQTAAVLYNLALDEGICTDYVRATIVKTRLPHPSGFLSDRWPWRLRLYTLGRFTVMKDDTSLALGGKAQKKPLELLRALAIQGGRDVSVNRLAQMLWPDTDGDMAAHALETTLYRLRKLIGEQCILTYEGQLTLNPAYCWVDVWAVEKVIDELQDAPPIERARELMDLYRGPFLAGDDTPWVLIERERIRSKFLRTVTRFGQALEASGNFEAAVDCYRKGIEVDPLAEELYRSLMQCYQHTHRPAEALALYKRCHDTLHSVLQIEPTAETKALYQNIKKSAS